MCHFISKLAYVVTQYKYIIINMNTHYFFKGKHAVEIYWGEILLLEK